MARGRQIATAAERPVRSTRNSGGGITKPPRAKRIAAASNENALTEAKKPKRAAFGDLTNVRQNLFGLKANIFAFLRFIWVFTTSVSLVMKVTKLSQVCPQSV